MSEVLHMNMKDIQGKHKYDHKDYEYVRKEFIPRGMAKQCKVGVYEIPPLKSAYPYHYHMKDEETFFIISGEGVLKTPSGEQKVVPGDLLFFPAEAAGAHKLTNTSSTEALVYLDFDTMNDLDACIYPDSNKIGVFGKDIHRLYPFDHTVDYYDGE